jgi:hypothetical protein
VDQLNFFKKTGTDVPVNQAGWASVIRDSMNFEFFGLKIKSYQNLILWLHRKKQMNKKFFFQHFIRYSLSCKDFVQFKLK